MRNKRIVLAILLILPLLLTFAQPGTNKNNARCIITEIVPRTAIVKFNGVKVRKGTNVDPNSRIDMPNTAIIRLKEIGSDKYYVVKGEKLKKLKVKTFSNYKQLNTKGADNLVAIKNYLNQDTWLMISDTAYIQFPAELSLDEFVIFKPIPHFTEYKPKFNYENQQIIITKSDLINNNIHIESDSIIRFQVEVHDTQNSVFVTDSLRIEYISFK